MITTEDFLHPYGICSDTTIGESDKPLTELLEEYAEAYDRAKLKSMVSSSDVSTRTFRFSGMSRGKKFVQEIIAGDRESAIAHFETTFPHLTWRTTTDVT